MCKNVHTGYHLYKRNFGYFAIEWMPVKLWHAKTNFLFSLLFLGLTDVTNFSCIYHIEIKEHQVGTATI